MSDDEVLSEAPSSPLSTALDTTVIDASSRATDGLNESFTSEISGASDLIKLNGKTYLRVDHTANQRKGAQPSWIWAHGDELRYIQGHRAYKNWRYKHYNPLNPIVIPIENTTYYAGEYLRKKHHLFKIGEEPKSSRRAISQLANAAYSSLISTVQADRFRYFLICWIVTMHIALSIVEADSFRELITYICPVIEPLLMKSSNTIRRWIMK